MNEDQLRIIVTAAVSAATERTRASFEATIVQLTDRLRILETPTRVEEYQPVIIDQTVRCEESLEIVKSLPEFNGDRTRYVSWRQAAFAAYKLFESFDGSSKHYQAVAIIRNKIVGSADQVLSSFNTVLNFKAILARLDFTYADKRPVYLIEQEMSTLRQGKFSIADFYDEVEKKLTLIINKTIMSHEGNNELIRSLCQKYRQDALRVFISGLRRPMSDIMFSSQPADMPSALALAQELEANHARYSFANSFNNRGEIQSGHNNGRSYVPQYSPHYTQPNRQNQNRATPMEVDPSISNFGQRTRYNPNWRSPQDSSRTRQPFQRPLPSNNQQNLRGEAHKRQRESDRQSLIPKIQRINHLNQNLDEGNYSKNKVQSEFFEEINFLGGSRSCHM